MPARSPSLSTPDIAKLAALGRQLRRTREELGVTAIATAEVAGMSRVTLHRIERGSSSVTMGAYLAVASALGLELWLTDPRRRPTEPDVDHPIRIADYPELARAAWHVPGLQELDPREALALYELNQRYVDFEGMSAEERALIAGLRRRFGGGSHVSS